MKDLKPAFILMLLFASIVLCSCSNVLNYYFKDTLPETEGSEIVSGITRQVNVCRDGMGVEFVEAKNIYDLSFAMGYVHASDRLSQVIGFKLISQGRISEMVGPAGLEIDIYMRTLNLNKAAQILYDSSSDQVKEIFRHYSDGVNAYIESHMDRLPPDIRLGGHKPEKWEPIDSVSVFSLVTLGLAFNLREEVNTLNIIQAIGAENTAWLLPIYPDEAIPFDEAKKLSGIDLQKTSESLRELAVVQQGLLDIGMMSVAASNNWAISKDRSANGASIFANDTHLPIFMPSMWHMIHARCPGYDAAGVGIPGAPGVIAGYNGRIAWGMTMVMADNEDIYLERLKLIDGKLHYLYKEKWIPTQERKETFLIKGEKPVTRIIHETIHGPLLNDALTGVPKNEMQSSAVDLPYGIALSWAAFEKDESIDTFLSLGRASSAKEALNLSKKIRAIPLNMVIADHDNIAWQVTGRFPIRKNGRGLMPSPGWTGEYDWTGYLDVEHHPSSVNPPEGFIGTANNRTVPPNSPHVLSSSWYWPERIERLLELGMFSEKHTLEDSMRMQLDSISLYVPKLKRALLVGAVFRSMTDEIESWTDEKRKRNAFEAIGMLRNCDGNMSSVSRDAIIIGSLLHTATYNTFFDELGPKDTLSWVSFLDNGNIGYCAQFDHLTVRGDESPFWDDINTPLKEKKASIIARSFADAIELIEERLGKDRSDWEWGKLHTYYWATEATKMAQYMGPLERFGMYLLSPYFNRGPYPASGDYTTLNVSGYHVAQDFDTWLIPEM
ncbi:MAG: penicillin acylase family protein, partial [Thermodesulfobacteriota bacterium]|nr:penicillin acylase family protein [Thermodesulfobacteriota bacterium]